VGKISRALIRWNDGRTMIDGRTPRTYEGDGS
jgi:hypothetical protein